LGFVAARLQKKKLSISCVQIRVRVYGLRETHTNAMISETLGRRGRRSWNSGGEKRTKIMVGTLMERRGRR
jgi:hypothetical protein